MEKGQRSQKIEKELQVSIAEYLNRSLPFKHGGILSVSRVRLSKDYKLAKVFLSYFHPQDDVEALNEVLSEVNDLKNDLQKYIARTNKLRFTPKVTFFVDETLEENFRLIQKLRDLGFSTTSDEEK